MDTRCSVLHYINWNTLLLQKEARRALRDGTRSCSNWLSTFQTSFNDNEFPDMRPGNVFLPSRATGRVWGSRRYIFQFQYILDTSTVSAASLEMQNKQMRFLH